MTHHIASVGEASMLKGLDGHPFQRESEACLCFVVILFCNQPGQTKVSHFDYPIAVDPLKMQIIVLHNQRAITFGLHAIPSCQIPMYNFLVLQVSHARGHLAGKVSHIKNRKILKSKQCSSLAWRND